MEKEDEDKIIEKYKILEETVLMVHRDSQPRNFLSILLLKNRYRNTKEDRIEENRTRRSGYNS